MNGFIPDKATMQAQTVPWFEDQGDSKIPGRGTEKSQAKLKDEIIELMGRLGAGGVNVIPGTHPGTPKRYGFQIGFNINGVQGRLDVAALPIKNETPAKKDRALAQALYLIRNWLEAEVFSSVYRPGAVALLPFLINDNGQTVTEYMMQSGKLPLLAPIVGGE